MLNRSGVSKMFVDGVTGFRVDKDYSQNAARIISRLLRDDDMLTNMRHDVQKYYQDNFSMNQILQRTLSVYEKVLSNKRYTT